MTIATLSPGLSSLILSVPMPLDGNTGTEGDGLPSVDFEFLGAWVSTVSGFTPSYSNWADFTHGSSLTIANLDPGTVYYVRWAYIPKTELSAALVDPTPHLQVEELSGTPNEVEALVADTLVGKNIMDVGTVATSVLSGGAIDVESTADFMGTSGCAVLVNDAAAPVFFKWAGKTSTSLTGLTTSFVGGVGFHINEGDVILPLMLAFGRYASDVGAEMTVKPPSSLYATGEIFPNSGTGWCLGQGANKFTWTGKTVIPPGGGESIKLTGLSWAWTPNGLAERDIIIVDPGFPTVAITVSAPGTYPLSAPHPWLNPKGGEVWLVKSDTSIKRVVYSAYDATGPSITLPFGVGINGIPDFTVIPRFSHSVMGPRSGFVNITPEGVATTSAELMVLSDKFSYSGSPAIQYQSAVHGFGGATITYTSGTFSFDVGGSGNGIIKAANVDDTRSPHLLTDFTHANAVQNDFTMAIIGTGALFTTAPVAAALGPNHPGLLQWRSGTTANSGVQCHTLASVHFRIGGGEQWDVNFRTAPVQTTVTMRSGAMDSLTSAVPVDGVYFEHVNGVLVGKCRSNNAEFATLTIATLAANTWVHGRIVINAAASMVTFLAYDDAGTLLGSRTAPLNIPTAAGRELGWGSIMTSSGVVAIELGHMDRQKLTNPGRIVARGAA